MKKREMKPNWFLEIDKGNMDLEKIQPARKALVPPPIESSTVPPFHGISRLPLLSKQEACDALECSMSHLNKQIRLRMIFPTARGRLPKFAIEEIENYNARESLRYMEKYA